MAFVFMKAVYFTNGQGSLAPWGWSVRVLRQDFPSHCTAVCLLVAGNSGGDSARAPAGSKAGATAHRPGLPPRRASHGGAGFI